MAIAGFVTVQAFGSWPGPEPLRIALESNIALGIELPALKVVGPALTATALMGLIFGLAGNRAAHAFAFAAGIGSIVWLVAGAANAEEALRTPPADLACVQAGFGSLVLLLAAMLCVTSLMHGAGKFWTVVLAVVPLLVVVQASAEVEGWFGAAHSTRGAHYSAGNYDSYNGYDPGSSFACCCDADCGVALEAASTRSAYDALFANVRDGYVSPRRVDELLLDALRRVRNRGD